MSTANAAAEPSRLFVYGTLMRGERSHSFLGSARFVEAARTLPRFVLLDLGWYPGMIELRADGGLEGVAVRGEVFLVDDTVLRQLDHYEGVPDLYRRVSIELERAEPALAYILNEAPPHASVIASGDWTERSVSAT